MFRKLHVGFSFRLFFSTSVDVEKKKMDFFFHIKFRLMWKIGVEKILMWKIRHYLDLKKNMVMTLYCIKRIALLLFLAGVADG